MGKFRILFRHKGRSPASLSSVISRIKAFGSLVWAGLMNCLHFVKAVSPHTPYAMHAASPGHAAGLPPSTRGDLSVTNGPSCNR